LLAFASHFDLGAMLADDGAILRQCSSYAGAFWEFKGSVFDLENENIVVVWLWFDDLFPNWIPGASSRSRAKQAPNQSHKHLQLSTQFRVRISGGRGKLRHPFVQGPGGKG
jgi:hypothetical protein